MQLPSFHLRQCSSWWEIEMFFAYKIFTFSKHFTFFEFLFPDGTFGSFAVVDISQNFKDSTDTTPNSKFTIWFRTIKFSTVIYRRTAISDATKHILRSLSKPLRQRRHEQQKFAYLTRKNSSFAHIVREFLFHFCKFSHSFWSNQRLEMTCFAVNSSYLQTPYDNFIPESNILLAQQVGKNEKWR